MSMPCLCLCLPLAPMKFCLGMDLSGKICQTLVLSMWKSQVLRSAHKKKIVDKHNKSYIISGRPLHDTEQPTNKTSVFTCSNVLCKFPKCSRLHRMIVWIFFFTSASYYWKLVKKYRRKTKIKQRCQSKNTKLMYVFIVYVFLNTTACFHLACSILTHCLQKK